MSFDPLEFRKNFPAADQKVNGKDLIYFDNAASSLKHKDIIERTYHYDLFETSNVHRGAHTLSRVGTENYEKARSQVQKFIGAEFDTEVIFTRGTTESVNLVAESFTKQFEPGDEILITMFEHHSNIVPWQKICEDRGLHLKVVPFDPETGFCLKAFQDSMGPKTKMFSFLWYSNSFGNRLPVEKIVEICRQRNIFTFIDAAQTPLHEKIDVQKLNCDFLAFSGHKIFAPYGIGMLYGKKEHLDAMPPYQCGGSMIDRVTMEKTSYANIPQKFEAGTPNVAGAIGLGAACELVDAPQWHDHLENLRARIVKGVQAAEGIKIFDFPAECHSAVVSFNYEGAHPSDVGTLLDQYGIAVRAGHHCTMPLMSAMGIEGTVRASVAPYNTYEEVEVFCEALAKMREFF